MPAPPPPAVAAAEVREVGEPEAEPLPEKPHLRGFTHLLAFVSALTLAPLMIVTAPGVFPRFVIALYALAIVGLFGMSALYHRINWSPGTRAVMRRLDHSMIFIAIAATYTPIALFAISGTAGRVVLGIVWIGAALGILSRLAWLDAPAPVVAIPYLTVGWACLVVVHELWRSLGVAGFVLVLVGGLLFTVGAIAFASRRPRLSPRWFGYHEAWHVMVIAGVAVHYVAVAFVVLPKA